MKSLLKFAFLAISASLVFVSCDPEPVVDPPIETNFSPSINLLVDNPNPNGTTGVLSSDVTFMMDETATDGATIVYVGIEGSDSTPALSNLDITRNGEKPEDFIVSFTDDAGTEITVNNPALLISPYDSTGFKWEIGLRTSPEYGVNTFNFVLTDAGGLTAETSITVTTEEFIVIDEGTPITGNLSGILLNQAGPEGTGGLDLDAGEGLGSSDLAAEIKDDGIDSALPAASNWKRTISSVNGTTIKVVDRPALGDDYDYTSVATTEEILAAWNTGIATGASTDALTVGDELVVSNADGSRYYLLQVVEVNNTDNDNADSYTFNIKW